MGASEGSIVIVTGSSGGIGSAIVDGLLGRGACIVGVDRVERALSPMVGGAQFVQVVGDVTCEATVQQAFERASRMPGVLSGMVTCVLAEPHAALSELTARDFDATYATSVTAAWRWAREFHGLVAGRGGSIVHVSSVHGVRTAPGFAAYGAAKAALFALTRSMALEWGVDGVRCNAVLPGFVRVERNRAVWQDPASLRRIEARTPLHRAIDPVEVANTVEFLLSDESSGITGACLPVDGGLLTRLGLHGM